MPYVAMDRLEDMIQPDVCEATASEIADAGLDAFKANVRRNTPIDTNPFRDRPGRPRGFARESIERTLVRRRPTPAGPAFRGEVYTEDPVFPYIEWDTPPHIIRPRKPGGTLSWRDRQSGDRVFAKEVRHPGTHGQHPFAIGAAITQHALDAIAGEYLERWKVAVTRSSVRAVDRRSR